MRERFSDRLGITRPRHEHQLESMDDGLRNGIWNWVDWALDHKDDHSGRDERYWFRLAPVIWDHFYGRRRDDVPPDVKRAVRKWFSDAEWYEVYNFVEFLYPLVNATRETYDKRDDVQGSLNYYLERELSGYRLIGGKLVPVTSGAEVNEIRQAATPRTGFEGVSEHINTAMAMLARKPTPDYRNSIKESISAVEAATKLLTGEKAGGIDAALARLGKTHPLHPAFKQALSKLYGYTSDEDGIRHPILEDKSVVTAADAKFMLVVCSAFANYLIDVERPTS